MTDKMQTQRDEFDAVSDFSNAAKQLFATAVVDDDYPQARHQYEGALQALIKALTANGRLAKSDINILGFDDAFTMVRAELAKAVVKFPHWPTDPLHAIGVVNEEVGELSKSVLQEVYDPDKNQRGDVRKEAVQAAAMAIRFISSLDFYNYRPGARHVQS